MKIQKDRLVVIDFTLTDADGNVMDSSEENGPLAYIHGVSEMPYGLQNAVEGLAEGEQVQVCLTPADGYGERDEELVNIYPREVFADAGELSVGMELIAEDENHNEMWIITALSDATVTVDANHPLAGKTLNFDVTIKEVRLPTETEMEHGHAIMDD